MKTHRASTEDLRRAPGLAGCAEQCNNDVNCQMFTKNHVERTHTGASGAWEGRVASRGAVGLGTEVDSSSTTVVEGVSTTLSVVVGSSEVPIVKAVVDVSARAGSLPTTAAPTVLAAMPARRPTTTAWCKLVIMMKFSLGAGRAEERGSLAARQVQGR